MTTRRTSFAWFTLLLAFAGCQVTLTTFRVPPQVWAGQVFEITLTGGASASSSNDAAAILQLPIGFVVEGAIATTVGPNLPATIGNAGTRDHPGLLALIAPEPGHYLASFNSHFLGSLGGHYHVELKVYVRAPLTPGGPHVLKAACAGGVGSGFMVTDPASTTSFATITTTPYTQPITVVADPVTPLVLETAGLFTPTDQGRFTSAALGDVDGDGNDDLACAVADPAFVGNNYLGPALLPGTYVWLARPGSSWVARHPSLPAAGQRGLRSAFGDFDGDGHLDLADSSGQIQFGDGGTTWTPGPVLPLLAPDLGSVAVGDVDGDGWDDVAVSTWRGFAIQVFRSNGNRTFASWSTGLPTNTISGYGPYQMTLQDVTGDGACDLVASGYSGYYTARVWRGNGLGGWTPANTGLPSFSGFAVGDLDRDGRPDLVVGLAYSIACCEFQNGAWQMRVMPGSPAPSSGASAYGWALAVLDYDRDGWPDLACGLRHWPGLQLVRNVAGLSFAPGQPLTDLTPIDGTFDLAVGDVDGDSWPDLAAAAIGEPPRVWRNTGSGLSPYGSACGAAGFPTPRTTAIGQPQLGNGTFAFELQNGSPNSFGMLWIGLSKRYASGQPILPFDLAAFGAPGCMVVASTEAQRFVSTDALGRAQLPMPIPNDPALQRVTVFAQGAAFAPGANNLGWLFGNGLAAKIP